MQNRRDYYSPLVRSDIAYLTAPLAVTLSDIKGHFCYFVSKTKDGSMTSL